MRVIAGTRRSLPLKTVPSDATRPTTDRIKETLFNMLQPYLNGAVFLDLFSGSGGIGIEALSRGASHAVFVDSAVSSIDVIRQNLQFTRLTEESDVIRFDAVAVIDVLEKRYPDGFDVIFMDPPYGKQLEMKVLARLKDSCIVRDDTVLIFEASKDTDVSEAETLGYSLLKQKFYGSNQHVWLKRK